MSRYTITVTNLANQDADPLAVIGYDRPLQTYFLQAFPDEEGEDLALWLGTDYRAFETLSSLRSAAMADGYDFMPLSSQTVQHLIDDHAREATRILSDEIADQFLNGPPSSR
ncbi:hypothetical protein GCM10010520_54070 [Rhizobium viscosum]|uniref:Uncharacterized protein n=1 Tax=Rhizobium viscosum TaxID=1673 RepID=A0ABR9IZZ5_RHIVS|nr:hypothetical protein [Rhizobium viscosum]MBE1508794.1 hypothetical protein [Rhizobium viscosum]